MKHLLRDRKKPRSERGFTLIELLAVIVVVGILSALLMPVFGRIKGQAESTKCVSNLRQIGAGITLYVADHDGYLPGPLSGNLHAYYTAEDTLDPKKGGRLACFLQGYISPAVATGGGYSRSDVFVCPAFARQVKKVNENSLPLRRNTVSITGGGRYPFGSGAGTDDATPPQPLAALGAISGKTLSQIWAIQDLDGDIQNVAKDTHTPKWFPDHPVHPGTGSADHAADSAAIKSAHPGAYRNALFFDFHVGRLDLEGNPM